MTTRIESGIKKLNKCVLSQERKWASSLGVKHRGLTKEELGESFEKAGYDFSEDSVYGTEIHIQLTRNGDGEVI